MPGVITKMLGRHQSQAIVLVSRKPTKFLTMKMGPPMTTIVFNLITITDLDIIY